MTVPATIAWLAVTVLLLLGAVSELTRLVDLADFAIPAPLYFAVFAWICAFVALSLLLRKGVFHRFLPAAIIMVGLVARVVWIWSFDSYQVSDYAWYFYCGRAISEGNDLLCADPLIWMRSLVYTAPFIYLFGSSLAGLEVYNLVLFCVASIAFYVLGVRIYGREITTLALVVFVSWPDYFFPITLASHDISGVLWLSPFFLATCGFYTKLLDEGARYSVILRACVVGVLLSLLEFSRSYELTAALALFFISATYAYRELRPPFQAVFKQRLGRASLVMGLGFALPYLVYLGSASILSLAGPSEFPSDNRRSVSTAAFVSSVEITGANTWREIAPWEFTQFPMLLAIDKSDFAIQKFLNEWTFDPKESVAHILRKNGMLSRADGNFWDSRMRRLEPHDAQRDVFSANDAVQRTNDLDRTPQLFAIGALNSVILLLTCARAALFPWLPFKRDELPIVYFSLFTYGALLFIGNSQPHYTIFLIFGFSYWCSVLLLAKRSQFRRFHEWPKRLGASAIAIGLVFFGFMFGAHLIQRFVLDFVDTSKAEVLHESDAAMLPGGSSGSWLRPVVDARFNRISLSYPVNTDIEAGTAMGVKFVVEDPGSSLELFLTTLREDFRVYHKTDNRVSPWSGFAISYCMYVNEKKFVCGRVEDYGARFLEIGEEEFGRGRPVSLKLVVWNTSRIEAGALPRRPLISMEYLRSTGRQF